MSPLLSHLVDPIGDTSASTPQGRGHPAEDRRESFRSRFKGKPQRIILRRSGYNMQYNTSFFVGRIKRMAPGTATASAIPRQSLTYDLAAKLHGQIVPGEIPEGARPRQDAIATQYRISRTPVREALRQLIAGLTALDNLPRREIYSDNESVYVASHEASTRPSDCARSPRRPLFVVAKLSATPASADTPHGVVQNFRLVAAWEHVRDASADQQLNFSLKRDPEPMRPPIFPVRVESLAFWASQAEPSHHA